VTVTQTMTRLSASIRRFNYSVRLIDTNIVAGLAFDTNSPMRNLGCLASVFLQIVVTDSSLSLTGIAVLLPTYGSCSQCYKCIRFLTKAGHDTGQAKSPRRAYRAERSACHRNQNEKDLDFQVVEQQLGSKILRT
jgi:hypothetical protein